MTPTLSREKVLEMLEKVLRMQESPNENEAAVAIIKARELMQKYGLTLEDVKVKESSDVIESDVSPLVAPIQTWEVNLGGAIARFFSCRLLYYSTTGPGRQFSRFTFIGLPNDVDAAVYMFQNLRKQLQDLAYLRTQEHGNEMREIYGFVPREGPESFKRYRFNFLEGAVYGIMAKLRQEMNKDNPNQNAIVLVKDGLVKDYLDKRHPDRTADSREERDIHEEGFLEGYREGSRLDVHSKLPEK